MSVSREVLCISLFVQSKHFTAFRKPPEWIPDKILLKSPKCSCQWVFPVIVANAVDQDFSELPTVHDCHHCDKSFLLYFALSHNDKYDDFSFCIFFFF